MTQPLTDKAWVPISDTIQKFFGNKRKKKFITVPMLAGSLSPVKASNTVSNWLVEGVRRGMLTVDKSKKLYRYSMNVTPHQIPLPEPRTRPESKPLSPVAGEDLCGSLVNLWRIAEQHPGVSPEGHRIIAWDWLLQVVLRAKGPLMPKSHNPDLTVGEEFPPK